MVDTKQRIQDTFILFSYVFLKVFLFNYFILFILSSFYFVSHYNIVYTLTLLSNLTG